MPPPPNSAPSDVTQFVNQMRASNARRIAERNSPADPLKAFVAAWFGSLPSVTRLRRYQLTEIVDALQDRTGHRHAYRHISAALLAAGFSRHRDYTKAGKDSRYWLPPLATKE